MNPAIKACAEAATLLAEIHQNRFEPVPPSWFTLEQFMEYQKCSDDKARQDMAALVKAGKFVSRQWPKQDRRGRTCHQTIYKKK